VAENRCKIGVQFVPKNIPLRDSLANQREDEGGAAVIKKKRTAGQVRISFCSDEMNLLIKEGGKGVGLGFVS